MVEVAAEAADKLVDMAVRLLARSCLFCAIGPGAHGHDANWQTLTEIGLGMSGRMRQLLEYVAPAPRLLPHLIVHDHLSAGKASRHRHRIDGGFLARHRKDAGTPASHADAACGVCRFIVAR